MLKDDEIFEAEKGYDQVAQYYDTWIWQTFWQKNELPELKNLLSHLHGIRNVLDIGCGTGRLIVELQKEGYLTAGIDVSKEMVKMAKIHTLPETDVRHGSAVDLPWKNDVFDVVIARRVLSHIETIAMAIIEAYRVASPDGHLLITDIHSEHKYRYGHTRVFGDWGEVRIQTYKHTLEQIIEIAEKTGWTLVTQRVLTANNVVWLPNNETLSSIDRTGIRPISFILHFTKTLPESIL